MFTKKSSRAGMQTGTGRLLMVVMEAWVRDRWNFESKLFCNNVFLQIPGSGSF